MLHFSSFCSPSPPHPLPPVEVYEKLDRSIVIATKSNICSISPVSSPHRLHVRFRRSMYTNMIDRSRSPRGAAFAPFLQILFHIASTSAAAPSPAGNASPLHVQSGTMAMTAPPRRSSSSLTTTTQSISSASPATSASIAASPRRFVGPPARSPPANVPLILPASPSASPCRQPFHNPRVLYITASRHECHPRRVPSPGGRARAAVVN